MTPVALAVHPTAAGYTEAVLAGDEAGAFAVLTGYLGNDRPLAQALHEIVRPALYEVGRLWQEAAVSVAGEHLATATTQSVLARLYVTRSRPSARGPAVVVTSTEGETHALGSRFVADVLEEDGWTVIDLGASTPAADLVELVNDRRPEAVALSTVRSANLPGAKRTLSGLRNLEQPPLVVVGGRAYGDDPRVAEMLGADLFVSDLVALPVALRDALART